MTVEERLAALETEFKKAKQTNRYLIWALMLIVSLGLGGAVSSNGGKEIQASRFVLLDENGTPNAQLCSLKGEAMLMVGMKGPSVFLRAGKASSSISLMDENVEERIIISAAKSSPLLRMFNGKGKMSLLLDGSKDATIGLLDGIRVRAAMGINSTTKSTMIAIYDENSVPLGLNLVNQI